MRRRWLKSGGWLLAVAMIAAVARAAPVQAQQTENPDTLRELVMRLLAPPSPGASAGQVQIFPGALPPGLPLDLPLPPNSRLVGSVVRPSFPPGPPPIAPSGESFDIVLDVPGDPVDVVTFYREAFSGLGWTQPGLFAPFSGGFLPSFGPTSSAGFCQSAQGPWLNVTVYPREDAPNDTRIHVDTGNPGPCAGPPVPPPPGPPPGAAVMPPLAPPPGVQVLPRGSGGEDGSWESRAIAVTDMSVADLEAFYAAELEQAGWTRTDGDAKGPLAWSTWDVPGEGQWQGFLYMLAGPGEKQRSLYLSTTSASQQEGGVQTRLASVVP
jgi:hypothetical protein